MKKVISVIINILSVISAVFLFVFAAFCAYDWITISKTPFEYSIDFWMVLDIYAICMFVSSLAGIALSFADFFILPEQRTKTAKVILRVIFIVGFIVSICFYLLPFNA